MLLFVRVIPLAFLLHLRPPSLVVYGRRGAFVCAGVSTCRLGRLIVLMLNLRNAISEGRLKVFV